MPKRHITPHKGGRTARLNIRLTSDQKAGIEQAAKLQNKSVADLIIEKTMEDKMKQEISVKIDIDGLGLDNEENLDVERTIANFEKACQDAISEVYPEYDISVDVVPSTDVSRTPITLPDEIDTDDAKMIIEDITSTVFNNGDFYEMEEINQDD